MRIFMADGSSSLTMTWLGFSYDMPYFYNGVDVVVDGTASSNIKQSINLDQTIHEIIGWFDEAIILPYMGDHSTSRQNGSAPDS